MSETSDNKYENWDSSPGIDPNWQSSVEEPTRSRLKPSKLTFPDKPMYPQKTIVFDQGKCTAVQEKATEPLQLQRPPLTQFETELRKLLNGHSMENLSATPDIILAEYMVHCLNGYNLAVRARERWYGRRVF